MVIGGSAAGLAAALQIARQQRSTIVIDNGSPRNGVAAHMHAYLGYEGASPKQLISAGRNEVQSYGGEVLSGTALRVEQENDRFRVHLRGGHQVLARRVLLATGLVDDLPPIEGLEQHWGETVINCPFCHGYEVRDRRIAQIITSSAGTHTVPLFRDLASTLTVVFHDVVPEAVEIDQLLRSGVRVVEGRVARILNSQSGELSGIEIEDGRTFDCDAVVVAPQFHVRTETLDGLDVKMSEHPSGLGNTLEVDFTGATSVPGLYAAGNVTDPSMQVLPAAAHGSRVGAAISMSLASEGFAPSGHAEDWDHRYSGNLVWSGNPNGTLVNEVSGLAPGRALDVGAGEGGDAVWLAEKGWDVTATDVSAQALERVADRSRTRGVEIATPLRNASALDAFPAEGFDLVSLQYGAIPRSPDQRGALNVISAVAPGGTLLVVAHDTKSTHKPASASTETQMWDAGAFVGVDEFSALLHQLPDWTIEYAETRPRPPGALSSHHVDDVVLRARRIQT